LTEAQLNELEQLFKDMCQDYHRFNWHIHWCTEPWVQFDARLLHLHEFLDHNQNRQLLIHGMTHVIRDKGGHDELFWVMLDYLVWHYLREELGDSQEDIRISYIGSIWRLRWWKLVKRTQCVFGGHRIRKPNVMFCNRCGLHCSKWDNEWSERMSWGV